MSNQFIWELVESEAPEKFFVNDAKSPAFLLFPKYHYLAQQNKVTLYLSSIGVINTFKTEKLALERLKQIVETANYPCKVFQVSKTGKQKGKKVLFAENKVQRWATPEADKPARTFNIVEWEVKQ